MSRQLSTIVKLSALAIGLSLTALPLSASIVQADSLPSWNDGQSKQSIIDFVDKVTKEGSPDFVPVAERIATFDNDGTLWAEQPLYFQLIFALDRVKVLAPQHPEWKTQEPFASVLKGDLKAALAGGEHALLAIVAATMAGLTTDEFNQIAKDWLAARFGGGGVAVGRVGGVYYHPPVYRGAMYGVAAGAAVGAAIGAAAANPYRPYYPPPACGYYPYPPCY